ncbi:hypothetical protein COU57_01850 [Candidatus Pacearchaeota archaeon CG10_big_fil_rev_8_21_14_0_10_32_14]|nr:MAG: hypothetical protein COU57_01850 [Candidatus Pacearchaeota archaeon CG10_big_fil_rev_8_21_14_0_10_32_14]
MAERRPSTDDVLRKYGGKIEKQIKTTNSQEIGSSWSRDYVTFKNEMAPELNRYERWCRSLGNIIKIKPSSKDEREVRKYLEIAHLDVEPWQALTLSLMTFLVVFLVGVLTSVGYLLIIADSFSVDNFPMLYFFLMMILAIFLFYYTKNYPMRFANKWRLKASSQMVPAILYVVVYMRHTANLEKAIEFASEHLEYPLALDFKKVFYDVQIGKYSTIKESLDNYLETWRDYSIEFIEGFHLIESSLFEPDNARRINTLEKALQVVLDGVYDKMLKFTHEIRAPLTNVYMLGVVLPTLGLALLPLASAMLQGAIVWYHVMLMFNVIVPFFVFYLTDKVLMQRPGGHGEITLLEKNPYYSEYTDKKVYVTTFLILLPFFIIGLIPLIFHYTPLPEMIGLQKDYTMGQLGLGIFGEESFFFDYKTAETGKVTGPFGLGALICSLFIPLGVALFFAISFRKRTKKLIVHRDNTQQLEVEFTSSLFQLGNRLGNGVPPELVFGKIGESSKGLKTEEFFNKVHYNIARNGMSVERAIFDEQRGALIYYPSQLISTSMRILVESSKKGLTIAAISLMSISEYVKNIKKINERLKDLLAEIVSDMKSNMTFLAPLLSGIVVGLAAMITSILNKLDLAKLAGSELNITPGLTNMLNIFPVELMIPPYYLQIIVGIYIIEIIFILTGTLVVVDSGEDKLQKTYKTGVYLIRGSLLYFITALLGILLLSLLTSIVLGGGIG